MNYPLQRTMPAHHDPAVIDLLKRIVAIRDLANARDLDINDYVDSMETMLAIADDAERVLEHVANGAPEIAKLEVQP